MNAMTGNSSQAFVTSPLKVDISRGGCRDEESGALARLHLGLNRTELTGM